MNTVYEVLAWKPLFSGHVENISWMESPRGSVNPKAAYTMKSDGTTYANSGYNQTGGARSDLYQEGNPE